MASSQYFKIVKPTDDDLKLLDSYKKAQIAYDEYYYQISNEDKFIDISNQRNILSCEESNKLYDEFYPKWRILFRKKYELEKLYEKEFIDKFENNYSNELCIGKELCYELFPEYKEIYQVSQLFSPIVKVDSDLIMNLRKVFSFVELKYYEEDKELLMNFVKTNYGKYIYH